MSVLYTRRLCLLSGVVLLAVLFTAPAFGQAPSRWAQRVAYDMDVRLYADRHQMEGTQELVYTNNSPDTLRTVYYHLYFNAFNPNSMMAERNRQLPDPDGRVVPRIFNLGPDEIGYHRIQTLTQDGEPVAYEVNDTVVRVDLNEPILPGTSTTFFMEFESQVPLQTRRSGRDNREGIDYSMSQWYPKIAAYDERGWHADPYVGREFYAPFGTFDVMITLPAAYNIGATGVLQNPQSIGHGYDVPGTNTYRPGQVQYEATDSLTWHFVAENVHDFAWAADPDYIHEQIAGDDGVMYHLLYQPDVEDRWEPMRDWVPGLIQYFSDQYGPYPYPQFTVLQAGDGGMEYPMVNFLTGRRSPQSLLGVTAHEAAHEWFYAVLGSNEADYAWIDEGFTSYATEEGVGHIAGVENPSHESAYINVLFAQQVGLFERLNTAADWFETNLGYGVAAYSGGEMIVEMLGYIIGEDNRNAWLRRLYTERQFQHPDPYDLEHFAEEVSGLRLDWYFEQFTNTTRELDYAVEDLDQRRTAGGWSATVSLARKAEVAVPQDVRLTLEDGSTQWVNIPLLIMHGHKPVPEDWVVTDPWPWTFPDYSFTVTVPSKVVNVELDPDGMTPDRNRLDNSLRFPVATRFLQPPSADWHTYSIGYRPLAQYADAFGPAVGMRAHGRYFLGQFPLRAMVKVWPEVVFSGGDDPDLDIVSLGAGPSDDPSFFDGIDYEFRSTAPAEWLGARATGSISAVKHTGFMENTIQLQKPLSSFLADTEHTLTGSILHQWNPSTRVAPRARQVVFFESGDTAGAPAFNPFLQDHVLSAKLEYTASQDVDQVTVGVELGGSLKSARSSAFLPFTSANRLYLGATKTHTLSDRLTGRADFQLGLGTDFLLFHKRYRLGGVSYENQWRSDPYRTAAAAFANPLEDAHVTVFSPAGPVAYLRRTVPGGVLPTPEGSRADDIEGIDGLLGSRMMAGRLSVEAQPVTDIAELAPLRLEAFSGIGQVWSEGAFLAGFNTDDLVADAGLGASYDVAELDVLRRWVLQSDVLSELKIVARFPLWASDPDLIEPGEDEFAFRWLIGIQTGF